MDNAREHALATGEEPPVLWKNHAAFIAILLQSGGGSEGKTGIQDGGLLCRGRKNVGACVWQRCGVGATAFAHAHAR